MSYSQNGRFRVAISMGDAAGIGPEITVKSLGHPELYKSCIPIVVGDAAPIEDAIRFTGSDLKLRVINDPSEAVGEYGVIELIDLGLLKMGDWQYKTVCSSSGEAAFQYVVSAIALAMNRGVSAVVTGPINKAAINLAGHHYSGHTEIFADYTGTKDYAMLLTSDKLRVIHVTTHVSMSDACKIVRDNPKRVENVIRLAHEAMIQLGVSSPRIAVAGLNAHCSEDGLFGCEEAVSIIPAIEACRNDGLPVEGPVPPDTVFVKAIAGKYDVVVAMYHDQGHIPLKLVGFKMDPATGKYSSMAGVNITIGLPIIRTSVDHGTAFGKAGEGRANEESLIDSVNTAIVMARHRFPDQMV